MEDDNTIFILHNSPIDAMIHESKKFYWLGLIFLIVVVLILIYNLYESEFGQNIIQEIKNFVYRKEMALEKEKLEIERQEKIKKQKIEHEENQIKIKERRKEFLSEIQKTGKLTEVELNKINKFKLFYLYHMSKGEFSFHDCICLKRRKIENGMSIYAILCLLGSPHNKKIEIKK